jgi:hypothetical protein
MVEFGKLLHSGSPQILVYFGNDTGNGNTTFVGYLSVATYQTLPFWQAPSLARKYPNSVKFIDSDKRTTLLCKGITCSCKNFKIQDAVVKAKTIFKPIFYIFELIIHYFCKLDCFSIYK